MSHGYQGIKSATATSSAMRTDDPTVSGGCYLVINRGATTIYVGSTSGVTTGTGTAVAAGQALTLAPVGKVYNPVYLITAASSSAVDHHYTA